MTITVYSKPACMQCTATTRALDMRGLDYRVIDLTQDADAMNDVTEMGYRQVLLWRVMRIGPGFAPI